MRAVAAFTLGRHGLRPYRPAQSGAADVGDIHGLSPLVLQAKDTRRHDLSGWLDGPHGVVHQARRAGEPVGVLVIKRPRRPVGDAYTVARLADHVRLLVRLRRAEALLAAHAPAAYGAHVADTATDAETPFPR